MHAIGYTRLGALEEEGNLIHFDAPMPTLGPRDLLVEVKAVSINPVDVKVRGLFEPDGGPRVIGYDAAGVVVQVGSEVSHFEVGQEVFYAGDLTRPGTNAQYHAVDERIVGKKPQNLSFPESAALPLTTLTAWELLFESFGLQQGAGEGEAILIVGAAGGVGSILIQLAKRLTGLTVIATASRRETMQWVSAIGADHVINHHEHIGKQMASLGIAPKYVASLVGTEEHFIDLVELIKPRGHLGLIDDPKDITINAIKTKALNFHWEFMFTRSMYKTDDMAVQRDILNRISELVDYGLLFSTMTNNLGVMTPESLMRAHLIQETGTVYGKHVMDVAW